MLLFMGYVCLAAAFYGLCCAKATTIEVPEGKVVYLPLPESYREAA